MPPFWPQPAFSAWLPIKHPQSQRHFPLATSGTGDYFCISMSAFCVVFYGSEASDQDVSAIVRAKTFDAAVAIAETEIGATLGRTADFVFEIEYSTFGEAGLITGPLYGPAYNRQELRSWQKEEGGWQMNVP
jgi:hypothetical protein